MSLTFAEAFHDPLRAWKGLRELVVAWDHDGLCRYRLVRVPITAPVQPGKGSYGGPHMQLKLSAADWLRGIGARDVEMERPYYGGIADVRSYDRRIAIECGYTRETKLTESARAGWACVWLPYKGGRGWRIGDVADALLVTVPHTRRGIEYRRPVRVLPPGPVSSSAFYLAV